MKRCKNITAWTDYPLRHFGDLPNKRAPIRHIRVHSYDGDKYATISVIGHEVEFFSVKWGYIYGNCARLGEGAKTINRTKLERMVFHATAEKN